MSVYLIARVNVKYGHMNEAAEILAQFVDVLKPYKWKLLHSFHPLSGNFTQITDIWELPDANALPAALNSMFENKKWEDLFMAFREHVESEDLQICGKFPFSP